jgi:predicted nucleic acid-binding protein
MFLLDTNVLSELARPRPSSDVVHWVAEQREVVLSVVSIEELTFGVERAPAGMRTRLTRWLEALLASEPIVLDVTMPVARLAGELRARREAGGRRLAQADAFIAATAVVHGLTLATRNTRDFAGCGVALFDPVAT